MKSLVKTSTLSKPNLKNFKLDSKIVQSRKDGNHGVHLLTEFGINAQKLAGRKSSLVVRGHILNKYDYLKDLENRKIGYGLPPLSSIDKVELRNEAISLLKEGKSCQYIADNTKSSLSTTSRLKKYLIETGVIKKAAPKCYIKKADRKVVVAKTEVVKAKPTNTYTNVSGENKEIARNKMVKYIVDSDVIGLIPSLPHIACTIEKKILQDQPSQKFIGVELHPPTFLELDETVKAEKLPITTYEGKLADKIYGQHEDAYAHIIADYCGELTTYAKEIEYAIHNKIVKNGGIMALTFGKPIRGHSTLAKFIKSLGGVMTNNTKDNRCMSDKAIEAYFHRIIGNDFQFLEVFNYSDDKVDADGNGYPMVLIILKRIK